MNESMVIERTHLTHSEIVKAAECTQCGAKKGEFCRTRPGRFTAPKTHDARLKAVMAQFACPQWDTEEKCECGKFHYHCQICGADCTAGTTHGPATKHLDGVRRCYECTRNYEQAQALLWGAAEDMLKVLKEVRDVLVHQVPVIHQPAHLLNSVNAAIKKATGR